VVALTHQWLLRPTLVENYSSLTVFWVCLPFALCLIILRCQNCHLWNGLTPFWVTKEPCDEIDLAFFETVACWNLNSSSDLDSARRDTSKNTPPKFFPRLFGTCQFCEVKNPKSIFREICLLNLLHLACGYYVNGYLLIPRYPDDWKKLPHFFVVFGCPRL